MALIDGKGLRIQINAANVLYAQTCTMNLSKEFNAVVHKDSAGSGNFTEYTGDGAISGTLNHNGLLGDGADVEANFNLFTGGTEFDWEFLHPSLPKKWKGKGFFSGFNVDAPVSETATLELPINITGEVTMVAV